MYIVTGEVWCTKRVVLVFQNSKRALGLVGLKNLGNTVSHVLYMRPLTTHNAPGEQRLVGQQSAYQATGS